MFTVIGTATVDLFVSNLAAMPRSEGMSSRWTVLRFTTSH